MKRFVIILMALVCCFSVFAQAITEEEAKATIFVRDEASMKDVLRVFQRNTGYEVRFGGTDADIIELIGPATGYDFAGFKDIAKMTANVDKGAIAAVTADGKVFAYPFSAELSGISYNADLLAKAGIDPASIKTWTDFEGACQQLKFHGITPIAMNANQTAWVFELAGKGFVVRNQEKIADGKFETRIWNQIAAMIDRWVKKGYVKVGEGAAAVKAGNAAFAFVKGAGEMPVPSNTVGVDPSFVLSIDAFAVSAKAEKNDACIARFFGSLAGDYGKTVEDAFVIFGDQFFAKGEEVIAKQAASDILSGKGYAAAAEQIKAKF